MANRRGMTQGGYAGVLPMWTPFAWLVPAGLRKKQKDFFAYHLHWLPLAANTANPQNVTIQGDADFLVCEIRGTVRDAATGLVLQVNNPITFQFEDTGSGRAFQNEALDLVEVLGTGTQPGYLPFAKLLRANSTVTVTLTNLDAANGFNVRIGLYGFKVFNMPEQTS